MPYILKKYYPLRNIVFTIGEGLLVFMAINLVYVIFEGAMAYSSELSLYIMRALLVTIIFQVCLYYFDLYDLSISSSFFDAATEVTRAFGAGCILLGFCYIVFPAAIISSKIFWAVYFVVCCTVASWRFFYSVILNNRMFTQPILLMGSGTLARKIAEEIENKRGSGYKIGCYLGEKNPRFEALDLPGLPDTAALSQTIKQRKIEKIVVALDEKRGNMPIRELMSCKILGIPIVMGINFYEELTGKILVEKVNPAWIIFSRGFNKSRLVLLLKRLVDVMAASIGLVISLPLMLICAVCVKLDSAGPVFFVQERVGKMGKPFNLLKFRSMRMDAEESGPVWAAEDDDRVTRAGRIIRKIRFDELPQFWNVLKGEMSLVGPRPERSVFVAGLSRKIPYYSLRHIVKPGVTGWAQTCYPYGASEEDALRKLEYDLYYIKNMSLWMDLAIIFQTIKIVLFQKGAR